jgi:short subunit dehydrogenase-like uncharacterized protein
MARRILLFGATGYTGGLVAQSLVARGESPVLVGRNAQLLRRRAKRLHPEEPLETIVLDVHDVGDLRRTISSSDVVVTTVGPFLEHGRAVAEAAAESGAVYLDCSGEPPHIRWIFSKLGARAAQRGARLMPGFGHEYVIGQLAGAWALERASTLGAPHRLEVGYFKAGSNRTTMSDGTLASLARVSLDAAFTYRHGAVAPERVGARTSSFTIAGKRRRGMSIGGVEHLTLPEISPTLTEVDVYLGWFGAATLALSTTGVLVPALGLIPGSRSAAVAVGARLGRIRRAPDAAALLQGTTMVAARVLDKDGATLGEVKLLGPSTYQVTAHLLAWAAAIEARSSAKSLYRRTGVLGAVQAYGLGAVRDVAGYIGVKEE